MHSCGVCFPLNEFPLSQTLWPDYRYSAYLKPASLHFKRLYLLDAVEERLPGTNPYDPLLPDPLRKLLGLPDARERDNVSGYNFYTACSWEPKMLWSTIKTESNPAFSTPNPCVVDSWSNFSGNGKSSKKPW